MPRARANAVAAKPAEPIKAIGPEEQVDLKGENDIEEEVMEEEVEYEEIEEEVEEEVEVEEEEEEEEEAEVVEEEEATVNANGVNVETHPSGDDEMKDNEDKEENGSQKHAELLALPPHGSEVYVGNIPPDASEEDLKSFCEAVGEVIEVRIMKGKNSEENKGYAFLTYRTKEFASKAIEDLNNSEFKGKKVKVSTSQAKHRLFIGNVPRNWMEDGLKEEVMKVGPGVSVVELMKDPQNSNRNRGFAFVEYYNHACAEYSRKKMSTPKFKLDTNAPTVSWADPKNGDSSAAAQVKALYVKNLPKNVTQDQLKELFKHHGEITKVVLPPAKSGQKNRFGFVHFAERSMATKALKNTEKYELDGEVLECSLAKPPADKKGDTTSNAHKPALLPTYPPRVSYGVVAGPYGALPAAYGAAGFGQSMIYGRGHAPAGMAMLPMVMPDGRLGYVLQQTPPISAPPQQRGGNNRSGGNTGRGRQGGDSSRGQRYRPY